MKGGSEKLFEPFLLEDILFSDDVVELIEELAEIESGEREAAAEEDNEDVADSGSKDKVEGIKKDE